MSEFTIEISKSNNVTIVSTSGYLDDNGGEIFEEKVGALIAAGNIYYVFDLEKTPVINSIGLSTLLDAMVQIIDYNDGEVAVTGLSKLTQTALQMTGVLTLCEAYPTLNEAIEAIEEFAE